MEISAKENSIVSWQVRAIRGAITVPENTAEAIQTAVTELLDELEAQNPIPLQNIISVTFSVTRDLNAIFPASVARFRPGWEEVALLDVQQMEVPGSLERCIRVLLQFNCPDPNLKVHHIYLRRATNLRPDWSLAQVRV